jgi:sugar/nucleoside kinase (ribokinase family)
MSLVVVGSPSVDLLHFRGRSVRSAGGAGLYTALAARLAGAQVTMIAPRPDPMPEEWAEPARLLRWRGPTVAPDALPHFEIAHEPGGKTTYLEAFWGSEAMLTPDHVPPDLEPGLIYIVPMLEPGRQVEFVRYLKDRDWRVACGTYARAVHGHRDDVLASIEATDIFFCNEEEAVALYGSIDQATSEPDRLLFITRGEAGARVLQGHHATDVRGLRVEELDPTGAGDTFCGAVLAHLDSGAHPVLAVRAAVAIAAEMVTGVGPERLLDPEGPPATTPNPRVAVDHDQIRRVAGIVAEAEEASAFSFAGPTYPDAGDPRALDFFFAITLQQFGFWTAKDDRYAKPMIARLGGRELKGSDFLWAACRRWLDEAPTELTPEGQAGLDEHTFDFRLRDDSGANPLPASEIHFRQAVEYGRDMRALGWAPADIVDRASESAVPVTRMLSLLDHVAGYKEDPWRKKAALLAAILTQRPERFLIPGTSEDVPPIVDYHCQRSCLRLGLVRITDARLRRRLAGRQVVEPHEEEDVRAACHEAVAGIRRSSGRPMGAVDWFIFQNRRRCPEMTEPDCAICPADPVCAHEKDLFQPVMRTAAY